VYNTGNTWKTQKKNKNKIIIIIRGHSGASVAPLVTSGATLYFLGAVLHVAPACFRRRLCRYRWSLPWKSLFFFLPHDHRTAAAWPQPRMQSGSVLQEHFSSPAARGLKEWPIIGWQGDSGALKRTTLVAMQTTICSISLRLKRVIFFGGGLLFALCAMWQQPIGRTFISSEMRKLGQRGDAQRSFMAGEQVGHRVPPINRLCAFQSVRFEFVWLIVSLCRRPPWRTRETLWKPQLQHVCVSFLFLSVLTAVCVF